MNVKNRILATLEAHPDWNRKRIAQHLACDPGYVRRITFGAASVMRHVEKSGKFPYAGSPELNGK